LGDRYGRNITTNELSQMMFSRDVKDDSGAVLTTEYILVSVVNEEYVEILAGVPINIVADNIIGA